MDKKQEYFLGLDIGTDSCGFAVTDEKYNIIKAHGKKIWGVRLFEEAKAADERRVKRSNRRRLVRRKLKLAWLSEVFEKEIAKVDPCFLDRLKWSSLWEDDKLKLNAGLDSKDSLFNDKGYSDREYYDNYPTIYHLRNELINTPATDIRLLFLALHNIIKRRGHFLLEGEMEDGEKESIANSLNDLILFLDEEDAVDSMFIKENKQFANIQKISDEKNTEIEKLLHNKSIKLNDAKKNLKSILKVTDDAWKEISDMLLNGKINIKKIFNVETEEDLSKLSFDTENYETVVLGKLEGVLSEIQMTILDKIRKVYSAFQLEKLLGGEAYICQALVNRFNLHNEQLKKFKLFVRKYYPSQYYLIFRENNSKKANYPAYVNYNKFDGKKHVITRSSNINEEFYKFIKSILNSPVELDLADEEEFKKEKQEIIDLIEVGNFLPKLRSKANATFPNQLYRKEVKRILEVNKKAYPFLDERDESGLTNAEKILEILKWRIPYFVGPLGGTGESENSWSNRDKSFDIKPWNMPKMIDFNKAEDEFILRMTNKCTYLSGEDVLPKHSLLYSKFRVLNELNNLKFNAELITPEIKQLIFEKLFCVEKKVTVKKIKVMLVREGVFTSEEVDKLTISGIDKEFANNYASFIDFSNILGAEFVLSNQKIIDKIIAYITIISDKERLGARISREFGEVITPTQIKEIKGLNYTGWGRLSQKFLEGMRITNNKTGEVTNIITEMWNTNKNLQELINDSQYNVQELLKSENDKVQDEILYDVVKDSYCSPSVKRAVWQTLKIIKEIRDTLGTMPKKVFVEVTRSEKEKTRTKSRRQLLASLYESKEFAENIGIYKSDAQPLKLDITSKDEKKVTELDLKLRSDKYYLYYTQLGKDIYTGRDINIDELHEYEIDHIIPQSQVKDDSLNNRVLTHKTCNSKKDNEFPVCNAHQAFGANSKGEWFARQKPYFDTLLKCKLITQEKYDRLMRTTALSDEEAGAFVARQLVETSQAATSVIDVLKEVFENPRDIVYSKGTFVSEFRQIHKIYKSREVNDFHHARDAYLNIVVGNILNSHYTDDPRHFYMNKHMEQNLTETERQEHRETARQEKTNVIRRILKWGRVWSWQTGELVWDARKDAERIKKICNYNDVLVSQYSYKNENAAYYDETVYKKGGELIPLKGDASNPLSNTSRYGGYNSAKNAYFMLFESEDKKGNKIKTIEALPVMILQKYKNDPDCEQKYIDYIVEANNLINAKFIMKINYYSTLKINDGHFLITGKSDDRYSISNYNQWHVDNETTAYIKNIKKYLDMKSKRQTNDLEEINGKVVLNRWVKDRGRLNNTQYEIALTREENIELFNKILAQLEKKFYNGTSLQSVVLVKLKEKYDYFVSLPVLTEAEILYNLVKKLHRGVAPVDLSLLGLEKIMGKLRISKNITDKKIYLIIPSVTGLYKTVIKL